jgi:hypothetical protein
MPLGPLVGGKRLACLQEASLMPNPRRWQWFGRNDYAAFFGGNCDARPVAKQPAAFRQTASQTLLTKGERQCRVMSRGV